MNQNTIEIGYKADQFAKGLFIRAVQQLAIDLQDSTSNSWNCKKIYELTSQDIEAIWKFTKEHYESHIHQLLTYGGKDAPRSYEQFATLQLGDCQTMPESYYNGVKTLHEYYEAFGMQQFHDFKVSVEGQYGSKIAYDRVIKQIGLEAAVATGAEHLLYITQLLLECKTPPNSTREISLVSYYQNIIKLLQIAHSSGKTIAHIIATLRIALRQKEYDGIHVHYLMTVFFEQHKSKGAEKMQEFLEAFWPGTSGYSFTDLMDDYHCMQANKSLPRFAENHNKSFIKKLVTINDFKKLHDLCVRSKANKTFTQRDDLVTEKNGYTKGIAYLNGMPLQEIQQQLESNSLQQHYIAFQNI